MFTERPMFVALSNAVSELLTVPVKSDAVLTERVYVSPAGVGADHVAVKEVFVAFVNCRLVGAFDGNVFVLPNDKYPVDIPLWLMAFT